jgi:hypothetical protein
VIRTGPIIVMVGLLHLTGIGIRFDVSFGTIAVIVFFTGIILMFFLGHGCRGIIFFVFH